MAKDSYSVVMRILDDQNRLTDRADTKAIALLTALGLFTVLFSTQLNNINQVVPFTVFLLVVYCISIILAVLHIVMAINPRIRTAKSTQINKDQTPMVQPTFFAGICRFPDANAYKQCINGLMSGDEAITDIYVRQVYEIAKINKIKYRFVGRAIWFAVISLMTQITLIVFMFSQRLIVLAANG
jgi:hypothetical protein